MRERKLKKAIREILTQPHSNGPPKTLSVESLIPLPKGSENMFSAYPLFAFKPKRFIKDGQLDPNTRDPAMIECPTPRISFITSYVFNY